MTTVWSAARPSGVPASPHRRVAWLLGIAVWLVYLTTAGGTLGTGDAVAMYTEARAIVTRGATDVPASESEEAWRGIDGRYYTPFGIGQPLYDVPFLLAGRAISRVRDIAGGDPDVVPKAVVALASTIPAAAAVAFGFLLAWRLSADLRRQSLGRSGTRLRHAALALCDARLQRGTDGRHVDGRPLRAGRGVDDPPARDAAGRRPRCGMGDADPARDDARRGRVPRLADVARPWSHRGVVAPRCRGRGRNRGRRLRVAAAQPDAVRRSLPDRPRAGALAGRRRRIPRIALRGRLVVLAGGRRRPGARSPRLARRSTQPADVRRRRRHGNLLRGTRRLAGDSIGTVRGISSRCCRCSARLSPSGSAARARACAGSCSCCSARRV